MRKKYTDALLIDSIKQKYISFVFFYLPNTVYKINHLRENRIIISILCEFFVNLVERY